MSVDIPEWERHLRGEVAEIDRSAKELAQNIATVRGQCEVPGIVVEVNGSGDITNLQIAPSAMRWTSEQLSNTLRACHRKARADATRKINRLIGQADSRIQQQVQRARGSQTASEPPRRPQTEEEIQAADDAYFQRMNGGDWLQ